MFGVLKLKHVSHYFRPSGCFGKPAREFRQAFTCTDRADECYIKTMTELARRFFQSNSSLSSPPPPSPSLLPSPVFDFSLCPL